MKARKNHPKNVLVTKKMKILMHLMLKMMKNLLQIQIGMLFVILFKKNAFSSFFKSSGESDSEEEEEEDYNDDDTSDDDDGWKSKRRSSSKKKASSK
jgi:hypothetical protein